MRGSENPKSAAIADHTSRARALARAHSVAVAVPVAFPQVAVPVA